MKRIALIIFIFLPASFLGQFGVELFISDISFAASRLVQGLPALVRTAARDQAVERKSCPEPSIPKFPARRFVVPERRA